MNKLEKLTQIGVLAERIKFRKGENHQNLIRPPCNGIKVYLRLTDEDRAPSLYSPEGGGMPPLRLGGDLYEVRYTFSNGKKIWHMFETTSGGRIYALDSQDKGPRIIPASDETFISMPAENYGKSARILLGFELD